MKLLAILSIFVCVALVNIGVLIFGWGLQAINWWVIIGGALVHIMFLIISTAMSKE
jgi:membrane protein YdbS with pleckstrin-like domain